jgi:hypothetical protein
LSQATTEWNFVDGACPIATVYIGALGNGFIGDERHGITMDLATHHYLHDTIGPRYASGLNFTTVSASTGQYSISSGEWYDDDFSHATSTNVSASRLAYSTGSMMLVATALTTSLWGGGTPCYNNISTGTTASLTGGQYGAVYVYAVNGTNTNFASILGQRTDTTIGNARANNTPDTLVLGSFPYREAKLLYRVIINTGGIVETTDYRNAQYAGSGYTPTAHASLTGLLNDDHTQYLLRTDTGSWATNAVSASYVTSSNVKGIVDTASYAINLTQTSYNITSALATTATNQSGGYCNASNVTSSAYTFGGSIVNTITGNSITSGAMDGKVNVCLHTTSSSNITVTVSQSVSPNFSATYYQSGSGRILFATTGSAVLRNRSSQTGSAGQYALVSLTRISTTDFILAGDTA